MRVLIADDDAVSRTILRLAIERLGHECLVAEDGLQAWEVLRASPVDVVVSDRQMPGLDGVELCRLVREAPSTGGYTYFIFLTALGQKDHLLAGMEAGADDYLTKPFNRDELRLRLIAAERVTALHLDLAAQQRRLRDQGDELRMLNRQLYEQARRDPLTGLRNRLQLWEDFAILDPRADRYGLDYAIALVDVDDFKRYNDTYGHLAGDEVLRRVARALDAECRAGDTSYRYGGEEFLVILPEQSTAGAQKAAERIRSAVESLAIPHLAHRSSPVLTLSIGVATSSSAGADTTEVVLRQADAALYRAKELGRNRVVIDAPSFISGPTP